LTNNKNEQYLLFTPHAKNICLPVLLIYYEVYVKEINEISLSTIAGLPCRDRHILVLCGTSKKTQINIAHWAVGIAMSHLTSTKFDESLKVWSGHQKRSYLNLNNNVGRVVLDILERTPNKVTQISDDTGVKVTCEETRTRSIHFAQNLRALGYHRGDVVCIAAKNSEYIAPVVFGCMLVHAPVSTVDPLFNKNEMAHMLSVTRPKLIVCDKGNADVVKDASALAHIHPEIVVTGNGLKHLFELADADDFHVDDEGIDYALETAAILCTSGTTGPQKGACLSHSHVLEQLGTMWHLLENDIVFCFR
jgi:non-ribosomal peptide synthetase component F